MARYQGFAKEQAERQPRHWPLTIAALILCLSACQYTGRLSPFVSDGCSRFPDGTVTDPDLWHDCCVAHDQAYWLGGDHGERIAADLRLRNCIEDAEQQALGVVMFTGVRVGGSPFWPTVYRWGYGWPYTRGYRAVTDEERQLAESLLAAAADVEEDGPADSGTQ